MKFVAMMRIKNEERWIAEVIESALPLCDRLYILDDHSTDNTAAICESYPQVKLFHSPFEGLDESRDKNFLLDQVVDSGADFCLTIDGDEVLEEGGADKIRDLVAQTTAPALHFKIVYLWNDRQTVRVDRLYDNFYRPSLFRISRGLRFYSTNYGGNLHCSSVPGDLIPQSMLTQIKLWHYGYIDADLRARKFHWYNKVDPNNTFEDCYRHINQGDPGGAPADASLRHAGPLRLASIA